MNLFLDVDGVLADFNRGALDFHGKSDFPLTECRWNFPEQIGFAGREADFWNPLGREFWATLPPTPECHSLLRRLEEVVGADAICLLTSPCATDGCVDGKLDWVRANLPRRYRKQILIGSGKEFCAGKRALLVDDHSDNCLKFFASGGQSILVPRPWNWHREVCTAAGGFDVEKLVQEVELKKEEMKWQK